MGKPKVAAIIQARMGSSRFPGKVLRPLAGKPVLWHLIHRLGKSKTIDVVAVATSTNPVDDPLEEFCIDLKVPCIRGSEDNVLDRYHQAARELKADFIVRVTGDAPLVDPEIIDSLVDHLIKENADYCVGDPDTPTIHEGFSPFSRQALEKLVRDAPDDPVAVEHVTAYIKQHPDKFKTTVVRMPDEHNFTGARISVDTPADLVFLEEVYRKLGARAGEADVADVVRLLKAEPDLLKINSSVRQKSASEKTRMALIRCDGDETIGLGHIVRCLALAEELRETHSWGVIFAVREGDIGAHMIQDNGFAVERKLKGASEKDWLEELITRINPDALVMDFRTNLEGSKVRKWRERGILVADIDDPEDKRLEADLLFYPPVPQLQEMNWDGFDGTLFAGWEWVILRKQFASLPVDTKKHPGKPPTILVTMGGSDPAGLTLKTAEALDSVEYPFRALFILGNAYQDKKSLKNYLKTVEYPYEIKCDVQEMATLMSGVDLAVASFGVTAYELAAMGVPALYLSLTEDHRAVAALFEKSGMGVNLGCHGGVSGADISSQVGKFLNDASTREQPHSNASSKVDGQGAGRIGKLITDLTDEKFGKP